MKAIQISHSQTLNIIELENPQAPGKGEVLLKMHYVGFCGSDINTFMGRNTMALNPVIPGHEIGAVIEAHQLWQVCLVPQPARQCLSA